MEDKGKMNNYCRTTSCFGEPQDNAFSALEAGDEDALRSVLADACPVGDDDEEKRDPPQFPLPDSHWLNRPSPKHQHRTLLQQAIHLKRSGFLPAILAAGARADFFNEDTGGAALHAAAASGDVPAARALLESLAEKPKVNLADVNAPDHNGMTPLHLAAESGHDKMLEYLLSAKELRDVDPEDLRGQRTPLYLAAKNKHPTACELLISHGASLKVECFGRSVGEAIKETMPFFDASKVEVKVARFKRFDCRAHLAYLLDYAEMNAFKARSNAQNLREFRVYLKIALSQKEDASLDDYDDGAMALFQKACKSGLSAHASAMLEEGMDPNATCGACSSRPVLLAAYSGYWETLEVLAKHNKKQEGDGKIVDFLVLEKTGGESILIWTLGKKDRMRSDPRCDYTKSLSILLAVPGVGRLANLADGSGATPLHLAALSWPQEAVRSVLELGANVGTRDKWDESAVSLIPAETLENFLDEHCLKCNDAEQGDTDFEITFDFSFLAPPLPEEMVLKQQQPGFELNDDKEKSSPDLSPPPPLPETESLWTMSQSDEHRHLLQHPVIDSFLWLKWHKVEGFFNRNLRLYLMFAVVLTWYVFERFGGIKWRITEGKDAGGSSFCSELSERTETGLGFWFWVFVAHALVQVGLLFRDFRRGCHTCNNCGRGRGCRLCLATIYELLAAALMAYVITFRHLALWTALTILLVALIAREVFQLTGSVRRYVDSVENWVEVAMIVLVGLVAWGPDDESDRDTCSTKRHLAAVSLMLTWAEFVTMVVRHPGLTRFNVYVTMFYRVIRTFLAFLAWYSCFVVSFGLGFYIMFHADTKKAKDSAGEEDEEEEGNKFFNNPWVTLVKTSTMFVGELEFGDLPLTSPDSSTAAPSVILSHLYLLAFVFFIVVVLMNLLNGLAVSDTGEIRDRAEAYAAVSRVETISYAESLLLGDPFGFLSMHPPGSSSSLRRLLPSLACARCACSRSGAVRDLGVCATGGAGVLLFYSTLPEKKLTVRPNRREMSCSKPLKRLDDADIIARAKKILRRKKEGEKEKFEADDPTGRIKELEDKLDDVLKILKNKA